MRDDAAISAVPAFPRGVRLHFDASRDRWILLAPERVFELDAVGYEVLRRVDGETSLSVIIDQLAAAFDAPRARIETDAREFFGQLAEKGLVEFLA